MGWVCDIDAMLGVLKQSVLFDKLLFIISQTGTITIQSRRFCAKMSQNCQAIFENVADDASVFSTT